MRRPQSGQRRLVGIVALAIGERRFFDRFENVANCVRLAKRRARRRRERRRLDRRVFLVPFVQIVVNRHRIA